MDNSVWDNGNPSDPLRNNRHEDEKSAKILEVDTWMPCFNSQTNQENIKSSSNHSFDPEGMNKTFVPFESPKYSSQPPNPVPSLSEEAVSSVSLNFPKGKEGKFRSAGNSPQVGSGSSKPGSRRGPFTPTRSECSWGYFSGYSGHPNYMSNTESSRAKVRSQSAPRQRLGVDSYGCVNKAALQGSWDNISMKNSDRSYPLDTDLRKRIHQVSNWSKWLGSANIRWYSGILPISFPFWEQFLWCRSRLCVIVLVRAWHGESLSIDVLF